MKKTWKSPNLVNLGVENTNYGTSITKKPDATITVGKFTFYSFS
jgi:hypothetical protein